MMNVALSHTLSAHNPPFLIGIAGGSCSGKSTLAKNLTRTFREHSVRCISHDDYYRDFAGKSLDEKKAINFDHPDSLETTLLVRHLRKLQKNQAVRKPCYDFASFARLPEPEKIEPTRIIIVEGILLFVEPALRELFDLKVFVDADADTRLLRKIERDLSERARTLEYILHQYQTCTRPMQQQFIDPTKQYADVVLQQGGQNRAALKLLYAQIREVLAG